jgi:hypothetical protein
VLLGVALAFVGVGCAGTVAGPRVPVLFRLLLGLVAVLTLVLVEALWWVRPWIVRAVDAWAAACLGTLLCAGFAVAVWGGLGLFPLFLLGVTVLGCVAGPCALVHWYVRDRAHRLSLAPGMLP